MFVFNKETYVNFWNIDTEKKFFEVALRNFEECGHNLKWVITKTSETEINNFIGTLKIIIEKIKKEGLKNKV